MYRTCTFAFVSILPVLELHFFMLFLLPERKNPYSVRPSTDINRVVVTDCFVIANKLVCTDTVC